MYGENGLKRIVNEEEFDQAAVDLSEMEQRKQNLLQKFEGDPLYKMVGNDYNILSDDILNLDQSKRYTTKFVADLLGKYQYLYDAQKGECYVNENRIRWWLNEKEDDNLVFYFNLDRPGRSWVWDVEAIVKAKLVSILRFCKSHQQKMIKVFATGLSADTPRITEENIVDLVERGNLTQVHNIEAMRDIMLAAFKYMDTNYKNLLEKQEEKYRDLYGQFESLQEENEGIKQQVMRIEGQTLTKDEFTASADKIQLLEETTKAITQTAATTEQLERLESKQNERDAIRDRNLMINLKESSLRRELRLEALKEWDRQNSGLFKRLLSKESEKEEFVENYINSKIEGLLEKYKNPFEQSNDDRQSQPEA